MGAGAALLRGLSTVSGNVGQALPGVGGVSRHSVN